MTGPALSLALLGAAILVYVLGAGVSLGAGVLGQRELLSRAITPAWELGHAGLAVAVAILFFAFPELFSILTTHLRIPILALLLGLPARVRVLAWLSPCAPFFLGVLAGALMAGGIDPHGAGTYALYVAPWLNPFCAAAGAFATSLFAFLAAVYLMGETPEGELRQLLLRKVAWGALAMISSGAMVFVFGEARGLMLVSRSLTNPMSFGSFFVATLVWFPFWKSLTAGGRRLKTRGLVAAIVALVLLGWFAVQYPVAVRLAPSPGSIETGLSFESGF